MERECSIVVSAKSRAIVFIAAEGDNDSSERKKRSRHHLREWRNGRRASLRCWSWKRGEGSSPFSRTDRLPENLGSRGVLCLSPNFPLGRMVCRLPPDLRQLAGPAAKKQLDIQPHSRSGHLDPA